MQSKALFILLLLTVANGVFAQDGVSTAGEAHTRYMGELGMIPAPKDVAVEDFVNYDRKEIGRPKAGEAVGLDVRWGTTEVAPNGDAILQVGLSTALANDRQSLPPLNLSIVIDKSGSMADDHKMVRVKEALLTLVPQLRPTDVLSIIVFDSDAEVLLPAENVENPQHIENVIRSIEPGSSTNLDAGLMLGYKEALKHFRKDGTNRLILLTDGIANRGVTNPTEIASESESFNDRGIDLCTIGVGNDVNQDFLRTLAKSGRGLFHFVADSQDIKKVFVEELQSQLSPVADEPNVEVEYGQGLQLEKVYGFEPEKSSGSVKVKLDNLNSGATEVVLLRFKPSGESDNGMRLPVTVRLSYYDLDRKQSVETVQKSSITLGESRAKDGMEDPSVEKNYSIALLAQSIHDMAAACASNQYSQGANLLHSAIDQTTTRYPSLDDTDIKRTLAVAQKYEKVLRSRVGSDTDDNADEQHSPVAEQKSNGLNLIPNGDFSRGNRDFLSGLDYAPPGYNALWGGNYTVAPGFDNPVLHSLIAPGDYSAPNNANGNAQVLYANVGTDGPLIVWSTVVRCKPNTRYRISCQCISLSGSQWENNHEIPTPDWAPDMRISVLYNRSQPQPAGIGRYARIEMIWDSLSASTATVSIVRVTSDQRKGLIGIADIRMTPLEPGR